MTRVVAVLGTFDTKGAEFAFLKEEIERQGAATLTVDAGILGTPPFAPDVPADTVAEAAGARREELAAAQDRGKAVAAMAAGAAAVLKRLHGEGRIHGVVSMGGGGGTAIAAIAMRDLPVGFPKLILSTLASGDISAIVGVKDIAVMPAVVDIAGLNRLSTQIIANAAGAIAGMVRVGERRPAEERPIVAATMFGVTTPCVTRARQALEAAGCEVLVFHAVGTGGRTMEALARAGFLAGVLDLTTTELADELAGGILSAGPDRLEAAGLAGVPQVVSLGALDMVNFGPRDTVPARYAGRTFYEHNPLVTLMRTTAEENTELGRIIAAKLAKATGPTVLMIPAGGVSAIDVPGKPFHDPAADAALIAALKAGLPAHVRLVEMDADINAPAFADRAAELLLELMRG